MSEPVEVFWGDILHPDSVRQYGTKLSERAAKAVPFLTGLDPWDMACDSTGGGLDDFWYVVVGGASNVGKTNLGLFLAQRAITQGFAAVFLTMEEPMDQIQRRIYAALSDQLEYHDFTYKRWNRHKYEALITSVPTGGKLVVNEELPSYRLADIMRYLDDVRDTLASRPMIVVVDHLQLVDAPAKEIVNATADVNRALRDWAKRNRTLTFGLSQLHRGGASSGGAPRRWDLWGGTPIEANATQVVILDHTAKCVDPERRHILRMWVLLDKNRVGPDRVSFPVEASLRRNEWRVGLEDELHRWEPNPWAPRQNGSRR